jgi:hypothetical protein
VGLVKRFVCKVIFGQHTYVLRDGINVCTYCGRTL